MSEKPSKAIEVFFSYSHKDEELRDELEKHLSILKRQGVITGWHDRRIGAGKEWEGEIDTHLNTADVILLLISADFLASDYCYDVEMKQAMKRHEAGEARAIPVILRPVDWKGAPLGKLQALPKDAKPVTEWPNRDAAFLDVARGIRAAVEELTSPPAGPHSVSEKLYPDREMVKPEEGPERVQIKYHLYISDSKLDMLWPQLPKKTIENIAANLNIDLDSLSRSSKAEIVADYIVNNLDVGTVDEPKTYFRGTLAMKTALMRDDRNPYVYFGGATANRAVALVGSPRHILGQSAKWQETFSRGYSGYLLPYIIEAFSKSISGDLVPDESVSEMTGHNLAYYIHWINSDIEGPSQRLEFLAKRLCESSDAVLGTPIYVALAE